MKKILFTPTEKDQLILDKLRLQHSYLDSNTGLIRYCIHNLAGDIKDNKRLSFDDTILEKLDLIKEKINPSASHEQIIDYLVAIIKNLNYPKPSKMKQLVNHLKEQELLGPELGLSAQEAYQRAQYEANQN